MTPLRERRAEPKRLSDIHRAVEKVTDTKRVRYPGRSVYFAILSGQVSQAEHAAKVEADRLKRLLSLSRANTIEEFKERFGL